MNQSAIKYLLSKSCTSYEHMVYYPKKKSKKHEGIISIIPSGRHYSDKLNLNVLKLLDLRLYIWLLTIMFSFPNGYLCLVIQCVPFPLWSEEERFEQKRPLGRVLPYEKIGHLKVPDHSAWRVIFADGDNK